MKGKSVGMGKGDAARRDEDKEPKRTEDGHHIVVNGRRWRATDPSIPDALRQELVDELMAARRAVKASEPDARHRVSDAKHALGERGAPWWEDAEGDALDERITAAIRALARKRSDKSICPSDVARIVGGANWRTRMSDVRRVAAELAVKNEVVVTQKGERVQIDEVSGPIRIRRGPAL